MKTIIDMFKKKDNLHALSAWITCAIMLFVFILAQILAFAGLVKEDEKKQEKMEVKELLKFNYVPPIQKELSKELKFKPRKTIRTRNSTSKRNKAPQKTTKNMNIASLAQGFDMKKLVSREPQAARRGGSNRSNPTVAGVSTEVNRQGRSLDNFDLSGVMENRGSSFSAGRRSSPGGANGPKVGIGGTSHAGTGIGTGGNGLALSGRGTSRSTRGNGTGNSGATISLPSGSGGGSGSLDIHALIKWMKAHPGTIPKLVAYDMGHRGGDLSSAIPFNRDGKQYTLFLSCNEIELLLRICLVENNGFTLLKDNGIREESNFLTTGDVVRDADRIQSLISSRNAPGNKAATFYQIFWSWWLQQPESSN